MQHIMNGYVVSAILYFKIAAKNVKNAFYPLFKMYMETELPQMICLVLKPIGSHIGIVEHFIQYELEHIGTIYCLKWVEFTRL